MPTDSISCVRQMAKELLKLGDDKVVRLVYETKHMEEDKTIADYDVTSADLITVIVVPAPALSRLQGEWGDEYGCTYIVDKDLCLAQLSSGQLITVPLSQDSDGRVCWFQRWHVDREDLAKFDKTGVLHWVPAYGEDSPLAWHRSATAEPGDLVFLCKRRRHMSG